MARGKRVKGFVDSLHDPGGDAAVSSVSSADTTLTITPTTGAVTAKINLSNANTWAALQTFSAGINVNGVTITNFVGGGLDLTAGVLSSDGPVTDVVANNSTLTISPTTGNVLAELNLGNANTWTATQTFQNIEFSADDTYDIGTSTVSVHKIFGSASAPGTARAEFSGLAFYEGLGDIFVGHDNVFAGFYAQRAMTSNSSATDNSDDYSNLYQGNSTWTILDMCYAVGDGTNLSGYTPASLDDVRNGAVSVGAYDATQATGGSGMIIGTRSNGQYLYFVGDEANNRMTMIGSDGTGRKGITSLAQLSVGGTNMAAFLPETDDAMTLGLSGNQWSHIYGVLGTYSGKLLCSAEVEIDGNLNHDGSNVGFYGTAPVAKAGALTAALTTVTHTTPGTPDYAIANPIDSGVGSAWGFSTEDEFETVMSVIANLQTRQNAIETALQNLGLIT